MASKVRVCFNVSKKTAMMAKLYRTECGQRDDLDALVNAMLTKALSKRLKSKGISLQFNQPSSNNCPKCKSGKLIERVSKSGSFLGCSTFPKCKYTKPPA